MHLGPIPPRPGGDECRAPGTVACYEGAATALRLSVGDRMDLEAMDKDAEEHVAMLRRIEAKMRARRSMSRGAGTSS